MVSLSFSGYLKLNIFIFLIQKKGVDRLNKHLLSISYMPVTILALELDH